MIVQARTSSRASKSGALFRQLARIGRAMPLLTASWLAVPILLGVLVIPFYAAQRELVDTFIGGSSWPMGDRVQRIWQPLAIFTGVSLLQVLLTAIHTVVDTRFRDRATMLVQTEVMRKAVAVPLSRMEQADYYNRLQRATSVAGTDLLGVLQQVILLMRQMFELFGLLAVAWMTHPVIGGLLALVFAVSLAIRLESELVVRRLNRDLTQAGRQSDYLREELVKPGTIKELRVFGSLDYMLGTWGKQMRRSLELRMNARRREIKHGIIVSTVQVIGLFAAILWMALHLQSGAMTAGAFVAILLAMRQAHGLSGQMAHPISKMAIQSTKMADLAAFLNERDTDEQAADAVRSQNGEQGQLPQWPSPCGSIVFDRVAFRYANANADEPVLQDIRLSLRAGETVALVGENGAGKSTLVKLLLGLYKPTAGTISWDGIDYEKLDPDALRARMSAAFQDFVRYETTLRDNVGFGQPLRISDDEAIHGALREGGAVAAQLSPDGLDAPIGLLAEGGRELSGGQWQRLAIARAALRDAQLLVLDEPTAALDPTHESELYGTLRTIAEGKTVLFISHRLGWARFADRIVVLKQGRIVEEGSHERLIAEDGEYAAMFRAQAAWVGS